LNTELDRIRQQIQTDDMQFYFVKGKGTTDAILVVRKTHEKFRVESWNVINVTVFPLISNRSRVSNTSQVSNRSRGRYKGEYTARLLGLPGISLCSNKYKTKNLGVLNTCLLVNRVVRI